jgi:hypothetical protein
MKQNLNGMHVIPGRALLRTSPESIGQALAIYAPIAITPPMVMDCGPAAARRPGMTERVGWTIASPKQQKDSSARVTRAFADLR